MTNENAVTMPYGFEPSYKVTLYFEEAPVLDKGSLKQVFQDQLGPGSLVMEDQATYCFELKDRFLEDGVTPIRFKVEGDGIGPDQSLFNDYAAQSWTWPEAGDLAGKIHYQLTLSDQAGLDQPYKERLVIFQLALYGLVYKTQPIGLQWHASKQIINPETYLMNVPGDDDYDPLFGPLNVRFYSIKETEDDTVMDTIGLAALGVVDVQCCFYGYEKEAMADLLYHYGNYIFWHGDVLHEGEKIDGLLPYEKWDARHELSQIEPRRPVLNIGSEIM